MDSTVEEETGLSGEIVKAGKVFEVTDTWGRWIIIPFLISVNSDEVKISPTEHVEYAWIRPDEVHRFDCVAGIEDDFVSVGLL